MNWIKTFFKWFCLMPDDGESVPEPKKEPEPHNRTAEFEMWAFGKLDSHLFEARERESLWNRRHGSEHFIIDDHDHFVNHMQTIVAIWRANSKKGYIDAF